MGSWSFAEEELALPALDWHAAGTCAIRSPRHHHVRAGRG